MNTNSSLDEIKQAWQHDLTFPYTSEWDKKFNLFIFRYVDGRTEQLTRS